MVWQKVVGYDPDKNALLLESKKGKKYWIHPDYWVDPEGHSDKIIAWFIENRYAYGYSTIDDQPCDPWINVSFDAKMIIGAKLPSEQKNEVKTKKLVNSIQPAGMFSSPKLNGSFSFSRKLVPKDP